jgi:hypothetical protein
MAVLRPTRTLTHILALFARTSALSYLEFLPLSPPAEKFPLSLLSLCVVVVTVLQFANALHDAGLVRGRDRIRAVVRFEQSLAKNGRMNGPVPAHGVLVQERVTANGHFHDGTYRADSSS